jgi:hypothetical protein
MSGHERARFSAPQGSHKPQSFSAAPLLDQGFWPVQFFLPAASVDYSREPGVGFGHCRSRSQSRSLSIEVCYDCKQRDCGLSGRSARP